MTPVYLMSPPRHDWQLKGKANFRSSTAQAAPDAQAAQREWASLADAICEAGGEVLVCPPHPTQNLTGMIYTAEAGELARDGQTFVLPQMAAPHRQLEADWIGPFMEGLGFRLARPEATWEAQGDALRAPCGQKIVHTYGVGPQARTSQAAYAQVSTYFGGEHLQLEFIADPWFHGNTFMGLYGDLARAVAVYCPQALKPAQEQALAQWLQRHEIAAHTITAEQSLGYDTNSLQVNATVIASATLSASTRRCFEQALSLQVRPLELKELFLKGGGAPVCLTNRLWGLDPGRLPKRHLWSARPALEDHVAMR